MNQCFRNNENDHLQSMMNAINLINLHIYKEDRKIWSLDGKGYYVVKLCSTIFVIESFTRV
jgi:hypothetical protein